MSSFPTIQGLLIKQYGFAVSRVGPHASFKSLSIDSLSALSFMCELEDRFSVHMPGRLRDFKDLADIATEIDRQLLLRDQRMPT